MRYTRKIVREVFQRFVKASSSMQLLPVTHEWVLEEGSPRNGVSYKMFWRHRETRVMDYSPINHGLLGKTAKDAAITLDAMADMAWYICDTKLVCDPKTVTKPK